MINGLYINLTITSWHLCWVIFMSGKSVGFLLFIFLIAEFIKFISVILQGENGLIHLFWLSRTHHHLPLSYFSWEMRRNFNLFFECILSIAESFSWIFWSLNLFQWTAFFQNFGLSHIVFLILYILSQIVHTCFLKCCLVVWHTILE